MLPVTQPQRVVPPAPGRKQVRAVRPALSDLRFKGDAWVVDNGDGTASVCLGDYQLGRVQLSPLDLPTL